jgi:hypothetical protein
MNERNCFTPFIHIAALVATIMDLKQLGFTDEDIEHSRRLFQAKAIVTEMMR